MAEINTIRKATLILRNMPRDIRDHFKAFAAKRGKSMKDIVIEFMKDCIKSDSTEKKGKKRRHGDT